MIEKNDSYNINFKIIKRDITKLATIHTKAKTNFFLKVNTLDELNRSVDYAKKNKLKIIILGKGTNILFTQRIYTDLLFIKLGKKFNFFRLTKNFIEVGGSNSLITIGKKLINLGYKDFIYMTLIPGTIGGAIRQNAGTTNEGEIKDNFFSANIYDVKEKKIIIFNKEDMQFNYRKSIIQSDINRYIILSAKFSLGEKVNDISALKEFTKNKKILKKRKEPKGFSFGSTFKNIKYPKPVWWYIDKVGLRNINIGGAKFSEIHSNWIINDNGASAQDILMLIGKAKERVAKKFNINLQLEIELI